VNRQVLSTEFCSPDDREDFGVFESSSSLGDQQMTIRLPVIFSKIRTLHRIHG